MSCKSPLVEQLRRAFTTTCLRMMEAPAMQPTAGLGMLVSYKSCLAEKIEMRNVNMSQCYGVIGHADVLSNPHRSHCLTVAYMHALNGQVADPEIADASLSLRS